MPTTVDPQEIINAAYQQFLQRDPDSSGLSFWETVLTQSGVKAVVGGIVHSVEWAQKHAPDAITAVNTAYLELLGRPSDADGLAYWIGIVNSLGTNSMLDGFLNSPEYSNKFGNTGLPGSPLVWGGAIDGVTPEDAASLQAYYNCLQATGSNFGNIAKMINSFYTGDFVDYFESISQAQQVALQDEGCMGLLTPAMRNLMLRAQQHYQQMWTQLHPGEGV